MTITPKTKKKPGRLAVLARRLREPSTMAGLSALALIAGAPPGVPELALEGVAGLLAALAVLLPEKHEAAD